MSQEKIEGMISQITSRYEEQLKEFQKNTGNELFTKSEEFIVKRRIRQIQREMHITIIREVGEYIISPFTHEPNKVISRFLHARDTQYFNREYSNPHPQLSEFMEWFCDSAIIEGEVESEHMAKVTTPV